MAKVARKFGINDMPRGWISKSKVNERIHNMWKGMLFRCYNKEFKERRLTYKECTCHEDFLLLSNFVKWIEQEPNYPLLVEDPSPYKWCIDKDSIISGNKEYTYGKMQLISFKDNAREAGYRQDCSKRDFKSRWNDASWREQQYKNGIKKAISVIAVYNNQPMFYYKSLSDANKAGYYSKSVKKCCQGNIEQYKGFTWYFIEGVLL